VISDKLIRLSVFGITLPVICLWAACGKLSTDSSEAGKPLATAQDSRKEGELQAIPSTARPTESEKHKVEPQAVPSKVPTERDTKRDRTLEKIDWGGDISLDEIVAMAKKGRIREIQWHVMPNVLRIEAVDGKIFHLKNENKGVDLRNRLIQAGVRIGKGGITFRHVF
jgi:hypothetical protein